MTVNGRQPRGLAAQVAVELGTPLESLADDANATRTLAAALATDIDLFLERLGFEPGTSVVVSAARSQRPLRVRVNGGLLAYPPALARRAWLAVAPRELQDLPARTTRVSGAAFPTTWLDDYVEEADSEDRALLFSFCERLAYAAIVEHPACLVRDRHVAAIAARTSLAAATIGPVLRGLVDLGLSVQDDERISEIIRDGERLARPLEDTVEAAFAELRSHDVELHLNPKTLNDLFKRSPLTPFSVHASFIREHLRALFRELEERFFAQYGFLLPNLVWVPSEALPPGRLMLKIDAWASLPIPMIVRGERFVEAPPEDVPIAGRLAVHPLGESRCTIVREGTKAELEDAGLTTWGPIDFVVANVFAHLCARASRLFGLEEAEHQLAQLQYQLIRSELSDDEYVFDGSFPVLVDQALKQHSLGELTRVLRAMIDERLSIQNLPRVLERLLQYDTVRVNDPTELLLDDRLATMSRTDPRDWRSRYEFLRKQLRPYITQRFAPYENSIVAYLLQPEFEAAVTGIGRRRTNGATALSEPRLEEFRDAVWREVNEIGPEPTGQVILTTALARPAIRGLLEPELPTLPVLAYDELLPDVNVQPIARVLLD